MLNFVIDFTLVCKVIYILVHKSWGVSSLCGCEKEVSLWGRNRREGGVSRPPPPPVSPSLLSPRLRKEKGNLSHPPDHRHCRQSPSPPKFSSLGHFCQVRGEEEGEWGDHLFLLLFLAWGFMGTPLLVSSPQARGRSSGAGCGLEASSSSPPTV